MLSRANSLTVNNNIRSIILEIKNERCKIVKILIFCSLCKLIARKTVPIFNKFSKKNSWKSKNDSQFPNRETFIGVLTATVFLTVLFSKALTSCFKLLERSNLHLLKPSNMVDAL